MEMRWVEVGREAGAYEVGDCDNGVCVRTLAEAVAVLREWYPGHDRGWPPDFLDDRPGRPAAWRYGLGRLNEALQAYCGEGEDAVRVSVVE